MMVDAVIFRCTCPECQRLDELPEDRQGIPGAHQTTFDDPAPPSGELVPPPIVGIAERTEEDTPIVKIGTGTRAKRD